MTDIPADWRDLPWPALRSVASKLSPEPIRNRADAVKAIELASRAPAGDEPGPVKFAEAQVAGYSLADNPADQWAAWPPAIDIPADWHETMTVAQIITLASQISPDGGNAVEIIQAEVARRSAAAT